MCIDPRRFDIAPAKIFDVPCQKGGETPPPGRSFALSEAPGRRRRHRSDVRHPPSRPCVSRGPLNTRRYGALLAFFVSAACATQQAPSKSSEPAPAKQVEAPIDAGALLVEAEAKLNTLEVEEAEALLAKAKPALKPEQQALHAELVARVPDAKKEAEKKKIEDANA